MKRVTKAALAAAAACGLGASASATMQPLYLQTAGIYNPGTTYVTTGTHTTNDYASDVIFRGNIGTVSAQPSFDLIGFCVDLFHNISVGLNTQAALNTPYHVGPLLTDSNGHLLTALQRREIGGLAARGFAIQTGNAPDKYADLAAIQGAIWTIEYPGSTIAASGGYGDLQSRIDAFVALAPSLHGTASTIYPSGGNTQGFIVSRLYPFNGGSLAGAVPEPEIWGLLLAGFGMVGIATRRRRAIRTVTA